MLNRKFQVIAIYRNEVEKVGKPTSTPQKTISRDIYRSCGGKTEWKNWKGDILHFSDIAAQPIDDFDEMTIESVGTDPVTYATFEI